MCSAYWTVTDINFTCPFCNEDSVIDIQTHFMGDVGSCSNYYKLFEQVPELQNVSATLADDFTGSCPKCNNFFDFGAGIKDGKVISTYVIRDYECSCGDIFKRLVDLWEHRREVHG